jgi:Uma2 family endonuclease
MEMNGPDGTSALKAGEKFTLDQWSSWPEGERWELIGGVAYAMSPAPRVPHQGLVGSLFFEVFSFLQKKKCRTFVAPVDVFLPKGDPKSSDTVVQPDVFVVCDPDKIKDDGIHGAPDFIVEVLSDSTAYKDMTAKKELYERSGVREYWIVNPGSGSVFTYVLLDGRYGPTTEILKGSAVKSVALPGFIWHATIVTA